MSQTNFAGFLVTAPANVPLGTKLQLQIELDGELDWSNVGVPVGAGGVVAISELEPLTGYWVRWTQVQ